MHTTEYSRRKGKVTHLQKWPRKAKGSRAGYSAQTASCRSESKNDNYSNRVAATGGCRHGFTLSGVLGVDPLSYIRNSAGTE